MMFRSNEILSIISKLKKKDLTREEIVDISSKLNTIVGDYCDNKIPEDEFAPLHKLYASISKLLFDTDHNRSLFEMYRNFWQNGTLPSLIVEIERIARK